MSSEPLAAESYVGESSASWTPESPFTEWEAESSVAFEHDGYEAEGELVLQRPAGIAPHLPSVGTGTFFIRIVGARQGPFAGDSSVKGREGWMLGSTFDQQVRSARDAMTGMASGRRMHLPLTITRSWSGASTQIFTALVTNETLPTVTFEFVATGPDGRERVAQRVTLTNGAVSALRRTAGLTGPSQPPVEQVSFVFQKIELDDVISRTSAQDDWSARAGELEFEETASEATEYETPGTPAAGWTTETYELEQSGVRPCDDQSRLA
ncbi:MAG: type secretion system secreted protein Hcp [Solirubrobacteraceae bacterium]|jgi:type VI secretion system secreted protein Hcp|nr:type secretion system secreted protein Hcp [Solirubrobacteraceae bacterium]